MARPSNKPETGMTENGMWYISPEQAAHASVVLIVYPDGVFGFTHNGVSQQDVGHILRRVSDHILADAVVEAIPDQQATGGN